eukprot:gene27343-4834_t
MTIDFCNKTFGEVQTGLTDVPGVWVERFGFDKINEHQCDISDCRTCMVPNIGEGC